MKADLYLKYFSTYRTLELFVLKAFFIKKTDRHERMHNSLAGVMTMFQQHNNFVARKIVLFHIFMFYIFLVWEARDP